MSQPAVGNMERAPRAKNRELIVYTEGTIVKMLGRNTKKKEARGTVKPLLKPGPQLRIVSLRSKVARARNKKQHLT